MKPYYSLSDFPDRKNAGKNFIARCPKCGTYNRQNEMRAA